MDRRFFFRCPLCLSVTASDLPEQYGRPQGQLPHCGLCFEKLECMGMVSAQKLISVEERCPCDARCTNARGPVCECVCCGENHGKGVLVKIIIEKNLPVLKPVDLEKARQTVAQYRHEYEQAEQRFFALPGYVDFVERRFIDNRNSYFALYNADKELRKIRACRVQHVRIKKLLNFLTPKQEANETEQSSVQN